MSTFTIVPSSSPGAAYPVPWLVTRSDARHPRVTNVGPDVLDTVRGFVGDRRGAARTDHWGALLPGDSAQLCLCAADLASTIVTLAWYRPGTGDEYLWRFVL